MRDGVAHPAILARADVTARPAQRPRALARVGVSRARARISSADGGALLPPARWRRVGHADAAGIAGEARVAFANGGRVCTRRSAEIRIQTTKSGPGHGQ